MGASGYVVVIRGDRQAVEKDWAQRVAEDAYEGGKGAYAGNATTMRGRIIFYDEKVSSRDEAETLVLDRHAKWTGPVAVSFRLPVEPTAKAKAAVEKAKALVEKASAARDEVSKKVRAAFTARKSKFVGCAGCGSKLSHEHVVKATHYTKLQCPLCKHDLLSPTDRAKIDAAEAKVTAAKAALEEASKPSPGNEVAWAVGGWAAC